MRAQLVPQTVPSRTTCWCYSKKETPNFGGGRAYLNSVVLQTKIVRGNRMKRSSPIARDLLRDITSSAYKHYSVRHHATCIPRSSHTASINRCPVLRRTDSAPIYFRRRLWATFASKLNGKQRPKPTSNSSRRSKSIAPLPRLTNQDDLHHW